MKYWLCFSILLATTAWSKSIEDFNQTLNQDVKTEIRKDEDKFKKTATRGPASVEASEPVKIEDVPKIDKNVRQIGPNEW